MVECEDRHEMLRSYDDYLKSSFVFILQAGCEKSHQSNPV